METEAYCKRRCEAVARWKKKHPERWLLQHTKTRAKAAGIPFNLTEEDIVIPSFCPLLLIELHTGTRKNGGPLPNSPSVDKIRPELGYN